MEHGPISNSDQKAHFQTLEQIRQSRAETLPILTWLIKSESKAKRIFDLAYVDLLFKINHESLMVDGASMDDEFLAFDREMIKGIHHYLRVKNDEPSTLNNFIEKFMGYADKFPLIRYLNDGLRHPSVFRNTLQKKDHVSTRQRLKLIREQYLLQKLCFKLTFDSNEKIKMVARHAFNATIYVIGAQYREIEGSKHFKQLSNTPIGQICHDYMEYLNFNRSHSPRKTKKVLWHWGHNDFITAVGKTPHMYFNDENESDLKSILAQSKESKQRNHLVAYRNTLLQASSENTDHTVAAAPRAKF